MIRMRCPPAVVDSAETAGVLCLMKMTAYSLLVEAVSDPAAAGRSRYRLDLEMVPW